ncbi:MAG: hypothetical protein JJU07_06870 [Natronohydrobacter sp.]|nr:hypothetical protein [Natronohydrobacter sp.]
MVFGETAAKSVEMLQQISKRAEDLTPQEQANSFVAIRRIDGALKNRDSRIIFGRRGTGKTHILSYVRGHAKSQGDISCSIDLRILGSNNSIYSDQNRPPHERATTLMRDLLADIHDKLLDEYTSPGSKLPKAFGEKLENLQRCVKTVVVTESVEERRTIAANERVEGTASIASELTLTTASLSGKVGTAASSENATGSEVISRGFPKLSVNMGDANKALSDLARVSGKRVWVLLDEWSSLPQILQPYLADFIRRAFLPVQQITVQIAAIEFRSTFRVDFADTRIGLELGSDISADINLDDYFVYDSNALTATEFFKDLLFKHLSAFAGERGLVESDGNKVLGAIFSQERVFSELVRASEGVARDFINILQLAAMRSDDSKISMIEIRSSAKDWFERDKQRNLDTNPRARALLDWIRDTVIEGRKARAFLLNVDSSDPEVEFLFDERLLHIARRSYSAQDEPGVRYRVWKVDFGCYVDLINTARNPDGFLGNGVMVADGGDIEVPEDDYRAVRRAILDLEEFKVNYQKSA